jgi:2-keto-3-deoxy-L-rhamnonate aldolase RhmA
MARPPEAAGAGGIIVPHVHDRKDAESIFRAAKFPPRGNRGYGGLCLSGQWGVNGGLEWMEWSNAETLVILMIEDISTMPHIDAILATEGVDAVLFGPADFSVSLGLPLQTGHAKVMDNLKKTVEAANKHGKFVIYPGAAFPQWETVLKCRELAVQAIELGHDVTILKAVWAKAIQAIKTEGVGESRGRSAGPVPSRRSPFME